MLITVNKVLCMTLQILNTIKTKLLSLTEVNGIYFHKKKSTSYIYFNILLIKCIIYIFFLLHNILLKTNINFPNSGTHNLKELHMDCIKYKIQYS